MKCPLCLSQQTELLLQKTASHERLRDYYECGECGLAFADPQQHLSAEEEKKRYDSHQNSPEDPGYVAFLSRLASPLLKHLKPGFQGLDFGCGPGPAMSRILRSAGFETADYDPFYFPDGKLIQTQYDFVTATEVLEHLRSPRQTLQLLDGLLKSEKSYLGIMTQIRDPGEDFKNWWYHKDPTHICFYQQKTLEWLARWKGWSAEFPVKNVVIYTKKAKVLV